MLPVIGLFLNLGKRVGVKSYKYEDICVFAFGFLFFF